MIIDAGMGDKENEKFHEIYGVDRTRHLDHTLAEAGLTAEDIDIVLLSHGHPDHIGGVIENGRPLFPNARYVIGGIEYDFWAPEGKFTGDLEKFASVFRALATTL